MTASLAPSILVLSPLVMAWGLRRVRSAERTLSLARAGSLAHLLASAVVLALFLRWPALRLEHLGPTLPGLRARWHLEVDSLAAPFLALASAVTAAVLWSAPRRSLSPLVVRAILASLGCALGVYCSLDLLLLAGFWTLGLLPGAAVLRGSPDAHVRGLVARTYELFFVLGSLPFVAAALLVGALRSQAALPFDLDDPTPLPARYGAGVFLAIALAVLPRKAVAPMHSWLPVLIERGGVAVALLSATTHLGAFIVVRVLFPLVPEAAREGMPALLVVALVSAVFQALVAVGQDDLRRMIGFVSTSQLALVLAGFSGLTAEGVHGALLQMLSLGLGLSGLLLCVSWIEARVGVTDMRALGGLALVFPRAGWVFFLLSLAAIGIPGSLAWVAEDLLLHSLLIQHPVVAAVLLLVTLLNGVTLLRSFFRVFFGPQRVALSGSVVDLRRAEFVVGVLLVTALFALGLAPQRWIDLHHETAEAITRGVHGHLPQPPRRISPGVGAATSAIDQ